LLLFSIRIGAFADTVGEKPSPERLVGLTAEATMGLANSWGMKSDENKVTIWTSSRAFNFQFADGAKSVIAMPDDRMVVSIAPYIMKTHPCSGHYPSTCRGELTNTPVHVTAVSSDGRTLVDEDTRTLPNGFIDLWLPRDLKVDVSMKARGLRASVRIGTFDTDITCITTPKLHY
ncbi:MAG: CueP family metal-binding protein, partial [Spirochaetia bacterium]